MIHLFAQGLLVGFFCFLLGLIVYGLLIDRG